MFAVYIFERPQAAVQKTQGSRFKEVWVTQCHTWVQSATKEYGASSWATLSLDALQLNYAKPTDDKTNRIPSY